MSKMTEVHNRTAGEIVAAIVKPVAEAGGTYADILVITESVILGVLLYGERIGLEELALDRIMEAARTRLRNQLELERLRDAKPAGRA
jgi:hypothetical protein